MLQDDVADLEGNTSQGLQSADRNAEHHEALQYIMDELITIHPEVDHPSGLTLHQHFNLWEFHSDLSTYSPEFLHKYKRYLVLSEWADTCQEDMVCAHTIYGYQSIQHIG